MEFERENPSCKFTIPDSPTVRQQLQYYSLSGGGVGIDMLERYWRGAKALITNWECEIMPDINTDLDKISGRHITDVITWAGIEVRQYLFSLEELPKNS